MKKFKFTMQTLLNVKLTLEKKTMGELAAANHRLRQYQAQLEDCYRRQQDLSNRYDVLLEDSVPVHAVTHWRTSFRAIRDDIVLTKEVIVRAEEERNTIQMTLLGIIKERKALESLRERQYEEYKDEIKREDAKIIDEFLSHAQHERSAD